MLIAELNGVIGKVRAAMKFSYRPYVIFFLALNFSATALGGPPWSAEDTDGDGLSDEWEIHYFRFIYLQNADGDPDGDGKSNSAEFEQGTDPVKANDGE